MTKEELQDQADDLFAHHPGETKVYGTEDGNLWFERNKADAVEHGRKSGLEVMELTASDGTSNTEGTGLQIPNSESSAEIRDLSPVDADAANSASPGDAINKPDAEKVEGEGGESPSPKAVPGDDGTGLQIPTSEEEVIVSNPDGAGDGQPSPAESETEGDGITNPDQPGKKKK